jgi:hypothetical protein
MTAIFWPGGRSTSLSAQFCQLLPQLPEVRPHRRDLRYARGRTDQLCRRAGQEIEVYT